MALTNNPEFIFKCLKVNEKLDPFQRFLLSHRISISDGIASSKAKKS